MAEPDSVTTTHDYATRVVAFVDILGFGDEVGRADKEPERRAAIIDVLRQVRRFAAPGDTDTDLRAQNFSDSLIVSSVNTPDGFWHLALSLDALAWNLLNLDMLARGAITIGGIHHDDEIVFGMGVNEAYLLESKTARYPRIIFSRTALKAVNDWAARDEIAHTYQQSRMRRGEDGVWHLNILTELGCYSRQPMGPGGAIDHWQQQGEQMRDLLQAKLDRMVDQPEVYAKIEWFARYWNQEVATSPGAHATRIGPIRLAGQEERGPVLPFRAHGAR